MRYCLLTLVLCLSLTAFAETKDELRTLAPGQPVEREIASGQTHNYQVKLAAGQFVRIVVEQKSIDVSLALVGSTGRTLVERDLTEIIGTHESLSFEAQASGDYRLTIKANGAPTLSGAYLVLMELKPAAGEPGRKRIALEQLLRQFQISRCLNRRS
jgi:hypothetical protein